MQHSMIEMGVEEAEMAATFAVKTIDGDYIKTLNSDNAYDQQFMEQQEKINTVKEECGIAYLYTLYTDEEKVYYGIDTGEDQEDYGTEFDYSYKDLQSVFNGQVFVQDFIDKTEYGDLISAYLPIKDSSGNVVAAIGCDYDASSISERIAKTNSKILTISVLATLISVLVLNFIIGLVMAALKQINRKLYDLVNNEGDLTQTLELKTNDELSEIANNVNNLLNYIKTIMVHIKDGSVSISDSAELVVKQLGNTSIDIQEVSATMEEMSAAMEETNASLNQINESVSSTNEVVLAIHKQAEEGNILSKEIMKKATSIYNGAIQGHEKSQEVRDKASASLQNKIEKAKMVTRINQLTDEIIGITEQTNLLALNASIEAARCGEQGKGFAVVAGEIKNLATNSATAAQQISEVSKEVIDTVSDLSNEAESIIKFMEVSTKEAFDSTIAICDDYKKDANAMSDMSNAFAEKSEYIQEVMVEVKESIGAINTAIDESTIGVTNVTEKTVDISHSVAEIEKEAETNKDISSVLNTEVNKFKLE